MSALADQLTTIITSAAVAAIVSVGGTLLNGAMERRSRREAQKPQQDHEVQLRQMDQYLQLKLQEITDRQQLRDRRLERIRGNMLAIVRMALAISDAVTELWLYPAKLQEPFGPGIQAGAELERLRAESVVDHASEALVRKIAEALHEHDVYRSELSTLQEMRKAKTGNLVEQSAHVQNIGETLRQHALHIVEFARNSLTSMEVPPT